MKLSARVVLHADDSTETVVHEVFHLDQGPLTPDSLGLGLGEAGQGAARRRAECPGRRAGQRRGGRPGGMPALRAAAAGTRISTRSWRVPPCSARCACPAPAGGTARAQPSPPETFRPLAVLLPERTTPELRHLESKFAGLT
jgi:hypothetical protein